MLKNRKEIWWKVSIMQLCCQNYAKIPDFKANLGPNRGIFELLITQE